MVARVLDAPLELLVGPGHALADAPRVSPAALAGHRIWIPRIMPGTEWAAFYQSLSEAFRLSIDALGPDFGDEALMDAPADSDSLTTLIGSGDQHPVLTALREYLSTTGPRAPHDVWAPGWVAR